MPNIRRICFFKTPICEFFKVFRQITQLTNNIGVIKPLRSSLTDSHTPTCLASIDFFPQRRCIYAKGHGSLAIPL